MLALNGGTSFSKAEQSAYVFPCDESHHYRESSIPEKSNSLLYQQRDLVTFTISQDPNSIDLSVQESTIEGRRKIVELEENWFASVKRRAERAVQRVQEEEQLELDEHLVLEAETVREQLEREDLSVPEHVDVRWAVLESGFGCRGLFLVLNLLSAGTVQLFAGLK